MQKVTETKKYRNYIEVIEKTEELINKDLVSAKQEAKEQGIAEGKQEALKEGLKKGEYNAKLETARNMLSDGLPSATVAKYTGLSIDEIKQL